MQNLSELVQVFNIIMGRILAVLDFADKAFRQFEFIGKIFLRYAQNLAFLFHTGDNVLINL